MGNAFVIPMRQFNTYRIFSGGKLVEGASMEARLVYLAAMDLDSHQAVTVDDLDEWEGEDVMALLVEHKPGIKFRRPTPDQAGMVTIRRTGSDSVQIPQEEEDDWMDGNETETSSSDIGQSPTLNESSGRHPGQSPLGQWGMTTKSPEVVQKEMAPFIRSNEVVEAQHQAPPPLLSYYGLARWNAKRKAIGLGPQATGYGSGPGGWSLGQNDWEDIN